MNLPASCVLRPATQQVLSHRSERTCLLSPRILTSFSDHSRHLSEDNSLQDTGTKFKPPLHSCLILPHAILAHRR